MAKRANGDGTVYQNKTTGKWIGEIRLHDKRRRVIGATKADAAKRLRDMIREVESTGGVIVDGNATLGQLIEQWRHVELGAKTAAPSTLFRYEWHTRILSDELGEARLRALRPERIEAMYDRCIAGKHGGKPMSRATVGKIRATLVAILNWGIRRGVLDRNAAAVTTVPKVAKRTRDRISLTPEQASTLYHGCGDHRLAAMWRLGLTLALRPAELAGLTWDDLDLDSAHPSLTVRHGVQMIDGRAVLIDTVKTRKSFRTLALTPILVAELRRHRAALNRERIAAGQWADDRLVFPSVNGKPLNPGNVRRALAGICERLGVPVVMSNELRHTAASLLHDQGVPLEQIADMMGHESTRMLDMTYRHRVRPAIDGAEVLSQMFAPSH